MVAHPDVVSGTGRSDLAFMRAGHGDWVTKVGADGVQAFASKGRGQAFALKISDGSKVALHAATMAVLEQLGWSSQEPHLAARSRMIAHYGDSAIISAVNGTHRKTLEKVLSDPVNGNIEWARIESLLEAAGCRVVEGAGSSVTFEFNGRKMTLHRPHPGKEALRYRVLAVREFVERMGIKP